MDKTKPAAPPTRTPVPGQDWREFVFKNRGVLLVPVAVVLLVFGRPSVLSAEIGLLIAAAGELLRLWAVGYAGETTRANVVTAPQLVTAGPYALMRNPLYVGNVLIAIGFTIALSGGVQTSQSYWLIALTLVWVIGVYAIIIPLEESFLAHTFGVKYTEYTTLVPRFIPWRGALAREKQQGKWVRKVIWRAETFTLVLFVLMVAVVLLKLGPLGRFTLGG